VSWENQYNLWKNNAIKLLPVGLLGNKPVQRRLNETKSFCLSAGATITAKTINFVSKWPKQGQFVHAGM